MCTIAKRETIDTLNRIEISIMLGVKGIEIQIRIKSKAHTKSIIRKTRNRSWSNIDSAMQKTKFKLYRGKVKKLRVNAAAALDETNFHDIKNQKNIKNSSTMYNFIFSNNIIIMSSDYDTYGNLKIKSVLLDAPSGLVFHDPNDDTKKATLKVTGLGVGNVDIDLPTSAGALLNAGSDLSAAKMTGIQALGQPGVADADVFMYADADDSNNPKGVAASDLKTYCNAGNDSLPAGSQNGQMVFYDNDLSQWSAAAPSGDISATKTGAMTVAAGAIDNSKVAAGANIEKSKLAALNIADADVAAGAAIAKSKLAALEIANADVAAGAAIAGSKVDPDFGAQVVQTTGAVQCGASDAFRLGGDSDGSWRVQVSGADLVFQKKETGTWNTKHTITAS